MLSLAICRFTGAQWGTSGRMSLRSGPDHEGIAVARGHQDRAGNTVNELLTHYTRFRAAKRVWPATGNSGPKLSLMEAISKNVYRAQEVSPVPSAWKKSRSTLSFVPSASFRNRKNRQ